MTARLTLAAATIALVAAGLLRPDSLLIAQGPRAPAMPPVPANLGAREAHLGDIDGSHLIFQSSPDKVSCDQMYVTKIDGTDVRRVSNGGGRTTCGFFTRDASKPRRTARRRPARSGRR